MVIFVSFAKPFDDLNGFIVRSRFDNDLLETSSQRVVFFDVLAVLVQRGRTDALNFATSQSGLENVRCVDGTFSTAGTDKCVEFVDEQDCVLGTTDFVHHCFDTFFELTAVLGTGNHHGKVQHNDSLVGQDLWDFARDDQLSETFDDGGFTNACFTQ